MEDKNKQYKKAKQVAIGHIKLDFATYLALQYLRENTGLVTNTSLVRYAILMTYGMSLILDLQQKKLSEFALDKLKETRDRIDQLIKILSENSQ